MTLQSIEEKRMRLQVLVLVAVLVSAAGCNKASDQAKPCSEYG
jgi:hypothetical protein